MNELAFIVFIDYAKAFDSVSHMQLFETMKRMGFPKHLVALLQQLYCDQKGVVKWNGTLSQPYQILSGVRQGCVISPSLFSLYTEDIMRDAEIGHLGVDVGGQKLSNLRYADDTAVLADSERDINELVERVNEAGKTKLLN